MEPAEITAILAEADRLQSSNKWRDAYEYLKPYSDSTEEPEFLWRLIRSYYRVGKHLARDKRERNAVAGKGLEILERALAIDNNHFNIQKWAGVFLSWASELKGTKNKIEKSFVIKEHFEKAVAINGDDATVKHLLGRWCFEVASVSWLMRKMANAIFAAPPQSSYEEALKYLMDSENTTPGLYTGNWLYLGKTYYQLSNPAEAKKWLQKLLDCTEQNEEDKEYKEEARQLMRKL